MTPIGTRTREISSPLGRVHCAITAPTGSGRPAISSSPLAIASMRSGVRVRRSIWAFVRCCAVASATSRWLAAAMR